VTLSEALRILRALTNRKDLGNWQTLDENSVFAHSHVQTAMRLVLDLVEFIYARESNPESSIVRAGKRWQEGEDIALKRDYFLGASISTLARRHMRSRSAIISRLRKHGLIGDEEALKQIYHRHEGELDRFAQASPYQDSEDNCPDDVAEPEADDDGYWALQEVSSASRSPLDDCDDHWDDLDPEYWETHLGGPDEAYFEEKEQLDTLSQPEDEISESDYWEIFGDSEAEAGEERDRALEDFQHCVQDAESDESLTGRALSDSDWELYLDADQFIE